MWMPYVWVVSLARDTGPRTRPHITRDIGPTSNMHPPPPIRHRYYTPCTGIGNVYGTHAGCAAAVQFPVKQYWLLLGKKICILLYMADKETTNFVILETQHFILKVDRHIMYLWVDTRANKMKSWEVPINMTTETKGFVPLMAYWRSWNLVDPTTHYFTVGHYLRADPINVGC